MAEVGEQVAFFLEHEYAVIKAFCPPPLPEAYRSFLAEALKQEVWPLFERNGFDPAAPQLALQVAQRIAEEATLSPEDRHLLLGHFPLSVRLSEHIRPIAAHLGTSPLLQTLLESELLFMHMPPMARFVPPHYSPAAVPAHQDLSYNAHLTGFVTVWMPLVEIDEQCGGLAIFEGSQHLRQTVGAAENGWLSSLTVGGYPKRLLTGLLPGDVVLLSPRIGHASAPNTSSRVRLSLDLRIFGATASSTKPKMNLQTLEITGT